MRVKRKILKQRLRRQVYFAAAAVLLVAATATGASAEKTPENKTAYTSTLLYYEGQLYRTTGKEKLYDQPGGKTRDLGDCYSLYANPKLESGWLAVQKDDGSTGCLSIKDCETVKADKSVKVTDEMIVSPKKCVVFKEAASDSPAMTIVSAGETLHVIGRGTEFWQVETSGRVGWVHPLQAEAGSTDALTVTQEAALRTEPNQQSKEMARLHEGETVILHSISGQYCKVIARNQTGYVHRQCLSKPD